MTSVVVIDDDIIACQYIRMVLEDTQGEFQLVGEATGGEKGLQLLIKLQPDILILDMEMPVMGGAELLQKLKELQMKMQVLILSCHDEYDFVRQAMKLGAADYLLKHREDEKTLLNALRNLRDEAEAKSILDNRKTEDEVQQKQALLGELLSGTFVEEERIQVARQLANQDQTVVICSARIDYLRSYIQTNGKEAGYRLEKKVWKVLQECEAQGCRLVLNRVDMGYYGILLVFDGLPASQMETRWQIYSTLTKYTDEVQTQCQVSVTVGVSERVQGAEEGYRQWLHACSAEEQKLYLGCGRIIFYEEMPACREEEASQQYMLEGLRSKTMNRQECLLVIQELFENIRMFPLCPECFMRLLYELADIFLQMISRRNLQINQIFTNVELVNDLFMTQETLEDYRKWCLDTVQAIFDAAEKASQGKWRSEVEQAIKYVEEHYMEKISLDDVADYVNVSKTYFCSMFKKETGQNFSLYVLDFRLEKACEFLQKEEREIYNIAYDTGFQSQNYFNNMFKKRYGITPKEYRRQFRMKESEERPVLKKREKNEISKSES